MKLIRYYFYLITLDDVITGMLQAFVIALNSVTSEDLVSRDIVIEEAFRLLNMVMSY